jgi:hypothetical protein
MAMAQVSIGPTVNNVAYAGSMLVAVTLTAQTTPAAAIRLAICSSL